jgi:hypothetical protein
VSNFSMMMELYSHGWARLLFESGTRSFEIEGAGYCTDVLGDLVRAATEVVCCAYRTEVSFDSEPLEWRLIVQARAEESTATLSLLEFDTPAGHEVFSCQVARDDFGRAVQRARPARRGRLPDNLGRRCLSDSRDGRS